MENNLFEILSSMMNKQTSTPPSQSSQNSPPMYPSEAYFSNQKTDSPSPFSQLSSSGLLPTLLSLMSGNGGQFSALSKIFSGGGDDNAFKGLLDNKKNTSQEGQIPRDDILL